VPDFVHGAAFGALLGWVQARNLASGAGDRQSAGPGWHLRDGALSHSLSWYRIVVHHLAGKGLPRGGPRRGRESALSHSPRDALLRK